MDRREGKGLFSKLEESRLLGLKLILTFVGNYGMQ